MREKNRHITVKSLQQLLVTFWVRQSPLCHSWGPAWSDPCPPLQPYLLTCYTPDTQAELGSHLRALPHAGLSAQDSLPSTAGLSANVISSESPSLITSSKHLKEASSPPTSFFLSLILSFSLQNTGYCVCMNKVTYAKFYTHIYTHMCICMFIYLTLYVYCLPHFEGRDCEQDTMWRTHSGYSVNTEI